MRLTLFAVAALCLSSLAAHADTFQYTVTLTNSEFPNSNFSFVTTGINAVTSETTLQPSQFTYSGGNNLATAIVLDYQNGGGIEVQHPIGSDVPAPVVLVADYSSIGSYSATAYNTNGAGNNQTLTLTVENYVAPGPVATTPEPSSLVLLGTGLLGALGATRKRFM